MDFISKIKIWAKINQDRIILFIGFALVASLCFAFGRLSMYGAGESPIIFQDNCNNKNVTELHKFIGSVKSNKYHLPTCPFAQKIKQENIIWFESKEDAQKHGYFPAKCVK